MDFQNPRPQEEPDIPPGYFGKEHNFEPGDKVVVLLPLSMDEGRVVEIVRPTGPCVISILGKVIPFNNSYQVFVDGVGDKEQDGKPIVYPSKFLMYARPNTEVFYTKQARTGWEAFSEDMKKLGDPGEYDNLVRVIREGVSNSN